MFGRHYSSGLPIDVYRFGLQHFGYRRTSATETEPAMSKTLDIPDHLEVPGMLRKLPAQRYRPFVTPANLRDVVAIFAEFPPLLYPINSAGELIEKLGGQYTIINVFNIPIKLTRIVKAMPAHYYPIASTENFVEKMAELLHQNLQGVRLSKALGKVRRQLPKMQFPINSGDELLSMFPTEFSIVVGRRIFSSSQIKWWVDRYLDSNMFPIRSEEALYGKAQRIIAAS
jgi:hypothetical protein